MFYDKSWSRDLDIPLFVVSAFFAFSAMFVITLTNIGPISGLFGVRRGVGQDLRLLVVMAGLFCSATLAIFFADLIYPNSLFYYRGAINNFNHFEDFVMFTLSQFFRGWPVGDVVEITGRDVGTLSPRAENIVFVTVRLALNVVISLGFWGFLQRRLFGSVA
jgi:hypothetical protein